MIKFNAEEFFWLASTLETAEKIEEYKGDQLFSATELIDENAMFGRMAKSCEAIGLRFTTKYIVQILIALNEPNFKHSDLRPMLHQLRDRMGDELGDKVFIHIANAKYYEETNLFGESVTNKLPRLITDIEEAGKCLALGRATATVFHLMRITEVGVQELGNKLEVILTQERNWQVILDQINKSIKGLREGTPAEKKQKSLYAQTASHLYNVKWAWRNPVMHPKESYTLEEAEDIFTHVKTFVRHLANEILV